ncbi:MAG: diguanylate cyclase [Desulfuromonadales bacterium]
MHTILLVEDDRFFREMFTALLAAEGYQVEAASCGAEGLSMLATRRYALVVTDLVMPDISGLEILSRVRESYPTVDVIVVTANADLESAIFALKHGARDYLLKPVNPDEFKHSVAQCIQQRRLLDENEELKKMLELFQTSQAIAGCLDLGHVQHLLVDALSREVGASRILALFPIEGKLELFEIKGMAIAAGTSMAEEILAILTDGLPDQFTIREVRFTSSVEGCSTASLLHLCSGGTHRGVVVLLHDPDVPPPDLEAHSKNIVFLMEQFNHAFQNISTVSEARNMLFIDDVSGLFNHRYLDIALEREMKRVERYASHLAILFIDVDAFKQVNDIHGHLVGSQVLAEFGALLKKSVRDVDIVIRYGGDEYTVILIETNCSTARLVAERIRRQVEEHHFMVDEGYDIRLTCSIGFACCPDDTATKQQLLEMADRAMYDSKAHGKNCVQRVAIPQ